MGKFSDVLFVTDFDGTLADHSQQVSEENRLAAEYFMAGGGLFTVATGRALGAYWKHRNKIRISAPIILSNGALIYDLERAEAVCEFNLPARAPDDCLDIVRQFPELAMETYKGSEISVYNPNDITRLHLKTTDGVYFVRGLADMPKPWNKVLFEQDTAALKDVKRYIEENFSEHYEVFFSNPYLLELTAKNVHKGSAVKILADLYKIKRGDIYCIGDNANDLYMLELAAIPFLPENAYRELFEFLPEARVMPHCKESCVAAAINELDRIYR